MVRNISQIVYQLFQKETLDEVSESELRYFIRQYPYAGTGHLLLAKKLQLDGEKRAFEREIAVTSIYFNNPAWLQFVLQEPNENGSADLQQSHLPPYSSKFETQTDSEDVIQRTAITSYEPETNANDESNVVFSPNPDDSGILNNINSAEGSEDPARYNGDGEPGISNEDRPGEPDQNKFVDQEPDSFVEIKQNITGELEPDSPVETEENIIVDIEENKFVDQEPDNVVGTEEERPAGIGENTPDDREQNIPVHIENESTEEAAIDPVPGSSPVEKLFYDDGEVFADFITEETNEEIRLSEETLNAPWELEEEEEGEDARKRHAAQAEPASDEQLRDNFNKRKHLTSEVVAGDRERQETVNRKSGDRIEEQSPQEIEHSDDEMVDRPDLISFEAQKASQRDPLPLQGENVRAPKDDESGDAQKLEFDPYHTIDYFASQGIKLRLEDFSRDKLGQQLKSFTEWIRSMKRLPQQVAENSMNETDQSSIRRIAEHSVEEKEVLTESMAEVWVKQGNYEKARQIYRKLSLQNPSKSTYFAAKIDQLKVL
jgi:hypothetical protein